MEDGTCEIFILFFAVPFAMYVWGRYYIYLFSVNPMVSNRFDLTLMKVTPLLCAVGLWWVIWTLGDPFVRGDVFYVFFYWAWGVSWVGLASWFFPLLGFSLRDDGVERRNTAATIALCGAFIGLTAAFAGGNIGEGPGWWVVLICVLYSTGSFLLAWFVLEFFTQISETITIERNVDAGVRLAALLIMMGILLGRSVSGNWIDMDDFVASFVLRAWFVIPLVIIGIAIEWAARPSVKRPHPAGLIYSLLPTAAYLAVFAVAVLFSNAAPVVPR
jgi:hypothetical protein